MNTQGTPTKAKLDAKKVSRFKKERALLTLSEDDFRDLVVRPLMLRMGLSDGRDLCGADEKGKDAIFFKSDPVLKRLMYAVQTKKGKINMTRKATENVNEALVQLRTALTTPISLLAPKEKRKPDFVILCASGKINQAAKDHIVGEIQDTRIHFMGSDEIIDEIDEHFPEYWYGIEADKFPYYRRLMDILIAQSDNFSVTEGISTEPTVSPITDDTFIQLYLHRLTVITTKTGGQKETQPHFEELPIQAILKKQERLVLITGEAGSGKSTCLRRIAFSIAEKALADDKESIIPVLIRCTDLEKTPHRLIEFAAETTSPMTPAKDAPFNANDLAKGNVLVLLDALDEVAANEGRRAVLKKIREFHETNNKCLVVLTSREQGYINELDELVDYSLYRLSPFKMEQAEKLVTRIIRTNSLAAVDAQETLRRIKEVHGVELSPLLVTIFVAITDENRQDIPANITELFKKYTEMMVGRWDKQKGLSQQIHAPIKDFLLRALGFTLHQKQLTSMPIAECRAMFERELESRGHKADLEILFEEIVYRSGLVRTVGSDIEFRHLLLQEFFAGRAIPSIGFLTSVVSQRWWTKAAVFYFGENPDKNQSIAEVMRNLPSTAPLDLYVAATALGLATQACYLSKTEDKLQVFEWVVKTLAEVEGRYIKDLHTELTKKGKISELFVFITYYVSGRDSVASSLMIELSKKLTASTPAGDLEQVVHESMLFWCFAGLIETGQLGMVDDYLKKHKMNDARHLFAIHLGCYYLTNLRITSSEKKDSARRIMARVSNRIQPLVYELLNEINSILLEQRRGTIQALPDPNAKEQKNKTNEAKSGPGTQGEGTSKNGDS